jgi:hypothetical protein
LSNLFACRLDRKKQKKKKNEKKTRQKFRILNDREMASGKSDQAELSR